MDQEALFYEDFRGAVCHLIKSLGGAKRVGGILRPTLSVKQAEGWVNDCLNPDRVTKFDFEDIVTLLNAGRDKHIHCAINQLAYETGYANPEIAPTKTPQQEIAEKRLALSKQLADLADEEAAIQRSETMAHLRAAK